MKQTKVLITLPGHKFNGMIGTVLKVIQPSPKGLKAYVLKVTEVHGDHTHDREIVVPEQYTKVKE